MTVFKAPYVIGKWLNVYHYFSSYRRQIEVFSSVCFIAVCEILYSREKNSMYFLKIPRSKVVKRFKYMNNFTKFRLCLVYNYNISLDLTCFVFVRSIVSRINDCLFLFNQYPCLLLAINITTVFVKPYLTDQLVMTSNSKLQLLNTANLLYFANKIRN